MGTLHLLPASLDLSANAGAWVKRTLNGRPHWVGPASMLVPGVLNGSKGPLFYPADEIRAKVRAWNGMPVTLGHPRDASGNYISARERPETLDRYQIGTVLNARFDGKLKAEAWLDEALLADRAPRVLNAILNDRPVELSTGLGTDDHPTKPSVWNHANGDRQEYALVARNHEPDHLAVLTDQKGACSVRHGCGLGVNHAGTCNATGNCPECGDDAEDCECERKGDEQPAHPTDVPKGDGYKANVLARLWRTTINALVGQPRSMVTGRLKPLHAGVGKGPQHEAAQDGFYGAIGGHQKPGTEPEEPETIQEAAEEGADVTTENAFCPTGEGGGVDPSCPSGEGSGGGGGGGSGGDAIKKAWAGTPDDTPDLPDRIGEIVKGMSKAELKETAAALMAPMKRPDGTTSKGWSKIKPTAEGIEKAVKERWGNVWRARNAMTVNYIREEDGKFCVYSEDGKKLGEHATRAEAEAQLRAIEANKQAQNHDQESDMATRKYDVAFLVANCDCWKGKAELLNNAALLDDAAVARLAAEAKTAAANALAVNALREKLGDKAPTVNEMPAFIKEKIEAKEDDEEEDDEDEEDEGKGKGGFPIGNAAKKGGRTARETTVNFGNMTPQQMDQLSKAMFGQPVAVVKAGLTLAVNYEQREKEIVANKLTDHIEDATERKARVKRLMALNLDELYDRLADRPTVDNGRGGRRDDDSGDRIPFFGGRTVNASADRVGEDDVTVNDESQVLDPAPPARWANNTATARDRARRERADAA